MKNIFFENQFSILQKNLESPSNINERQVGEVALMAEQMLSDGVAKA
jgi:hypothetical protein